MTARPLPFVDVISVAVAAPPEVVWPVLLETFGGPMRSPVGRLGSILLDARPADDTRRVAEVGELHGFGVREISPPNELLLAGRHRFSDYTLRFRLVPTPSGTELAAETHAAFPGPHGAAYKTAVIRSGAHAVIVRRLLHRMRSRAESRARR